MAEAYHRQRPWGFGLCTRIVYIHQAFCVVLFVAGLRVDPARGLDGLIAPHLLGIAISVAALIAIFAVATRKSLKALFCLRLVLWIAVVKIVVVQLWLLAHGQIQLPASVRAILINELLSIPLALYWSRPVHFSYLASFSRSQAADAA